MNVPSTPWIKSREDRLAFLWAAGKSASQIAADLGNGITRCAVIGKVHRMKLPARAKRCTDPEVLAQRKRKATASQVESHRRTRGTVIAFTRTPAEPVSPPPGKPEPLNLSLADRGHFDCHWIENDDTRAPLYCGHPVKPGTSWCEYHHRVVKPPKPPANVSEAGKVALRRVGKEQARRFQQRRREVWGHTAEEVA